MRTGWAVFYFMTVSATLSIVAADADPLVQSRIAPQDLKWERLGTGIERSNIAGDDTKAGVYVYLIRFPANSRVAPHFHPDERVGTVLSGTFYFGYGTQFNETALKSLPAGSSWTEPSKQPHFAWAKDGEVVIQVVGFGPSSTTRLEAK
jgi:quercetin dioxygenase-like cupin family protein